MSDQEDMASVAGSDAHVGVRPEGLRSAGRNSFDRLIFASLALGRWLSAALDDPNVCAEMKADINEWFSAGEPVPNPALHAALAPFARLYSQITADHGLSWLPDEASAMRASLSYPTAQQPVFWGDFRRAAEALAAARDNDEARREATARSVLARVVVYQIEDDDRIHLSIDGRHMAAWPQGFLEAQALLRLDADQREFRSEPQPRAPLNRGESSRDEPPKSIRSNTP